MRFPGFIGPTYKLRSVDVDCQRCINLYPELNELGTGKGHEVASLASTPGLSLLVDTGTAPIRAEILGSDGVLYAVIGNKFCSISSTWVKTVLGTLTTTTGQVSIADSGNRLAIVDGSVSGFFWNFTAATFTAIPFPTDIDFKTFAGCAQVSFQDGYFIYAHKGTGQFFWSGQVGSTVADDSTIDPLDFNSADGAPDPIAGHISVHRDLWMFNSKTTEVFFNSGSDPLFQRVDGAFIEVGLAATFSIAKIANQIFWLGQDEHGSGQVYSAQGYQPQRISTYAVEAAIQSYSDISDAVAYTYQEFGHQFYVLNFPTADTTWVYDVSTRMWHERAYLNNGNFERHRANCHAYAYGKHVVGDYENGKIYELSSDVYSDNGAPLVRQRIAPHNVAPGLNRVFFSRFQLDIEAGVGLDGTQQGTDPQAMLQWSDDGGHSWSSEHWVSCGKIGQKRMRAIWRKLGQARDRIWKISISDPVKVVIIGAEIDGIAGAS